MPFFQPFIQSLDLSQLTLLLLLTLLAVSKTFYSNKEPLTTTSNTDKYRQRNSQQSKCKYHPSSEKLLKQNTKDQPSTFGRWQNIQQTRRGKVVVSKRNVTNLFRQFMFSL